jgi:hypothetical protein
MISPFNIKHNMTDTMYGRYAVPNKYGMQVLRDVFPKGKVKKDKLVFLSTGGLTGHSRTVEDIELSELEQEDKPSITFVILDTTHVVTMYGNAVVSNADDLNFLTLLRDNSIKAMMKISKGK